ncbi:uncharacterized protein [Apostichopus japonicus]|uniref:uncharacterized protein isoform X2 n=1 Tax=Stichopus japonicus TaxID=307972 RepID=UPI003AB8EED6
MTTSLLPALPRVWPEQKKRPAFDKLHSFYYTGLPVNQYYDLTLLKKSNIRSNDELVPRPTQADMSKLQINKEFPAEHPYSSHMSRFAVFPNFANSRDDYKTGEAAQQQRPLHPQMPANPYSIRVVRQSKGGSDRWERQELPLETEKMPLKWPGDTFFQQRKTPTSGQQQFYPIPPKAVLPNHPTRSLDHTLNPKTANALRNIERAQWQTTYNRNFTGYGPANALRLDNFDQKLEKEQRTGIEDHGLRTRSYNTFMPPRPLEGRISRLIGPNQSVRCVIKDGRIKYVPYVPKITIEMDKVREHPNLPSETHDSFRVPAEKLEWKRLQSLQHPETQLEKLNQRQASVDAQSLKLSGDTRKKAYDDQVPKNYLKEMAEKHKDDLKRLTDQARWKEAERREHHHDLTLLKRKVDYTSPQMQPPVYYDTLHKIYTAKAPFYYDGDNPYEYDYVLPWDYHKTNAVLDQYKKEGEMMEKAENVGEGTNTARETGKEEYQFAGSPGANPFVTSSDMSKISNSEGMVGVKSSPPAQNPTTQSTYTFSYSPDKVRTVKPPPMDTSTLAKSLPSVMADSGYDSRSNIIIDSAKLKHPAEANNDLSNSNPNATSASSKPLYDPVYRHPHSNPVVDSRHFNAQGTADFRFRWTPSYPYGDRPQTTLLKMQDSFTKSDARKSFHGSFPENNPDLRDNIGSGKKHDFHGQNAYYWH